MYLAFYDFNHDPFSSKSTAPPLYVPPGHTAVVTRLMDAITERRGFMALLGEAGMGKTSLIRAHLAETDSQQLKVIYLPQADVSFETLVRRIYDQFGFVAPLGDLPEMIAHLHALFIEEHKKGRNIALVIDDAHTMPLETLRDVYLLSNIVEYPEKLLQIVLVAQPHIEQLFHFLDLIKGGNPFTTTAHLQRLSYEESVCYIQTHLINAQERTAPVVSHGAIRAIATSAQGVPQRLRSLCSDVLVAGYRSQVCPVSPRVARRVLTARSGCCPRPQSHGAIRAIAASVQGVPRRLRSLWRDVLVAGYRSQLRPAFPRVARRVLAIRAGRFPRPRMRRVLMSAASVLLVVAGLVWYGQRSAVFDVSPETRAVAQHAATGGSSIEPAPSLPQETAAPAEPVVIQEPVEVASAPLRAEVSTETRDVAQHVVPRSSPNVPAPSRLQETAAPADPVVIQEPVEVASAPLRPAEASDTPLASVAVEPVSVPPQSLQPAPSMATRGLPGAVDDRASAVQEAASFLHRSFPNGGDFRLNVWTERGGSTVYSAGERLVVHVVAESTAYLQVDYYQADGQVVHLLPNPLDTNLVVAGQTFSLGQPESSFQFNITPPFGAEMLMVIASQRPFIPQRGAPNIEPADAYMARLQQNLNEVRSHGKVAVASLDLLTQKQ